MINKIKSYDMFGFELHLNINSNGKDYKHKTMIGGICSIVLGIIISVIVYFKL